jgi:hypothetical protein
MPAARAQAREITMALDTRAEGQQPAVTFNYSSLDEDTRVLVEDAREKINLMHRRGVESAIEIGRQLIAVKAALPHGSFGLWIEAEFGWSAETAQRFMRVAEQFQNRQIDGFQPSALYALASGNVSDDIREEFIARAEAGERVTFTEVMERLNKLRAKTHKTKQEPTIAQYRARKKAYWALLDDLSGIRWRLTWLNKHGGLGEMAKRWGPSLRKLVASHIDELIEQLTTIRDELANAPCADVADQAYLSAELRASLREVDARERKKERLAREQARAEEKRAKQEAASTAASKRARTRRSSSAAATADAGATYADASAGDDVEASASDLDLDQRTDLDAADREYLAEMRSMVADEVEELARMYGEP